MKIDYKNPTVYYIGIPALAGLWAVMAGFVFYPNSIKAWEKSKDDAVQVEEQIKELIALQPQRLNFTSRGDEKPEKFDFAKVINEFSEAFGIPDPGLTIRPKTKRSGRISGSANILIKDIEIEKMVQFLSALLMGWPDMKCDQLSIEKIKNTKNHWKVNLSLTYYYE